jgi:hypothetical protein
MQTNSLWIVYLVTLNVLALFSACVIVFGTINDLMLDRCLWLTELKRRIRHEQKLAVDVQM